MREKAKKYRYTNRTSCAIINILTDFLQSFIYLFTFISVYTVPFSKAHAQLYSPLCAVTLYPCAHHLKAYKCPALILIG